jgi:hypothetical protein
MKKFSKFMIVAIVIMIVLFAVSRAINNVVEAL